MAVPLHAVIATNRFGLGATPGELASVKSDPRAWLTEQVTGARPTPDAISALPSTATVFKSYTQSQDSKRENKKEMAVENAGPQVQPPAQLVVQGIRKVLAPIYLQQVIARYEVASTSKESLRERLVHFWSNHFAASADKVIVLGLVGGLENEAIRPNLSNRFVDLLCAVETHPAMILYLDNQQSSGPNSQVAKRVARRPNAQRKLGINENLAREILELHTLGVNGGYTQKDVTTFAEALTGWSVGGGRGQLALGAPGEFIFREPAHEPGSRTVLGRTYSNGGYSQGKAILEDLARHPSTAKFIATKLVRHFVNDEPPAKAVEKIAKVFIESEGHLPTVHRAVIELKDAWQESSVKYKTPHEFVVSSFRALDYFPKQPQQVLSAFDALGQRPYTPGSPAGWPDVAGQWDGPDALMKRIEWAATFANRIGSRVVPLNLSEQIFGNTLSDHTRTAISRAESAAQALTLLLMSPDFQRR